MHPEVVAHIGSLTQAICAQLQRTQANLVTRRSENVRVLVDTSYLSKRKLRLLNRSIWEALAEEMPNFAERKRFLDENVIGVDLSANLGFLADAVPEEQEVSAETEYRRRNLLF